MLDTARHDAATIAQRLGLFPPTDEQRAIIEADPDRPMLVVAGAGSGKTETMSNRVVWLVANGFVQPDQVLGLTFTRKAAGQLAERVARQLRALRSAGLWVPEQDADGTLGLSDSPTVLTYHSYAGRLVREQGLRLGIEPDARMLTEAASWQYAAEVVHGYDGPMDDVDKVPASVISAVVSLAGEMAEHLLTPEEVRAEKGRGPGLVDHEIWRLQVSLARAAHAPVRTLDLAHHLDSGRWRLVRVHEPAVAGTLRHTA